MVFLEFVCCGFVVIFWVKDCLVDVRFKVFGLDKVIFVVLGLKFFCILFDLFELIRWSLCCEVIFFFDKWNGDSGEVFGDLSVFFVDVLFFRSVDMVNVFGDDVFCNCGLVWFCVSVDDCVKFFDNEEFFDNDVFCDSVEFCESGFIYGWDWFNEVMLFCVRKISVFSKYYNIE